MYEMLLRNLPLGYSTVDSEGVIVEFNPAAERITGYVKRDVVGKMHLELLHGSPEREACPLFYRTVLQRQETVATETTIRRKTGEIIPLSVTTFPLFDGSGEFVGGVELFMDISERKRLERERKNILSMFAHDMKSPVTTSVGFIARILMEKAGAITEKQRDYLQTVEAEMDKVLHLISDFLDFSRLESGQAKPVLGPYSIETELYRSIEAVRTAADDKGITIVTEFPEEMVSPIAADAAMIHRVISNLLVNAIKYTEPSGIVTVTLRERAEEVLVSVIDTGPGIPHEHLPFLFDAFYRVRRDTEGSGLGLTIAKTIVEAHGGRIWAESVPGQGSTFTFTLSKT